MRRSIWNGEKSKTYKKADKKFDEILDYLNGDFGRASALKFIERTYLFFDIITDFPNIGTIEDSKKGIYGFVIEKRVTIFHKYTKREVIILIFFGNRRNPKKCGQWNYVCQRTLKIVKISYWFKKSESISYQLSSCVP